MLDREFKRYLHAAQINVDPTIFNIKLPDPENFGIYRQQEMDSNLLNTMAAAQGINSLSEQFKLQKYLHLTDEEILLNYHMKCEEKGLDPDAPRAENLPKVYGLPEEGAGMDMMGPTMTAGSLGGGYATDFSNPGGDMTAGNPAGNAAVDTLV